MPVFHDWVAEDISASCVEIQELLQLGEFEWALEIAEDVWDQLQDLGVSQSGAVAQCLRALCLAHLAEDDDALADTQAALESFRSMQDSRGTAEALSVLAEVHRRAGRLDEASTLLKDVLRHSQLCGSTHSLGSGYLQQAQVCLDSQSFEEAADSAALAYAKAVEVNDEALMSRVACFRAVVAQESGNPAEALREAAVAARHLQPLANASLQVDIMIVEAAARYALCEEKEHLMLDPGWCPVIRAAKKAVQAVKIHKPNDLAAIGTACFTLAQACLKTKAGAEARASAKEALVALKQTSKGEASASRRAHCLLIMAQGELLSGPIGLMRAQDAAEQALNAFKACQDDQGRDKAGDVLLEIDDAVRLMSGLPSREEEAEQERIQQQALLQQQYMMQQMALGQGSNTAPQMGAPMQSMQAPGAAGAAAAAAAPAGQTTGPKEITSLGLSSGLDPKVLQSKILELAVAIIGEDDVEADTPLMDSGLTSNTAVLLRDTLSKELVGISLPPTLIFDYPSVSAITEFIAVKSG
mmetsp:Transcript_54499/g.129937  ORF Transcript_54499/g.129937 Transcript_54499/m.129937 type:complete len:527 (+) Transcript_54499:82-1662(+)